MEKSEGMLSICGLGGGGKAMCKIMQVHTGALCKFFAIDCIDKAHSNFEFSWDDFDALSGNFRRFSGIQNSIEILADQCLSADNLVFVIGLGGGTGTSLFKIFASSNKFNAAHFVCFLPFKFEGESRAKIASEALEFVHDLGVPVQIYPNQHLFEGAHPKETFTEAFKRQAKKVYEDLSPPNK